MLSSVRRGLSRIARPVAVAVLSLAAVAAPAAEALAWEPGVDVSRYQHSTSLDWAKVQAGGVEFAFIKATEGRTYTNPYFAGDWAATTDLGLYRGAYHFARPSKGTAAAQASYFVQVAGLADQPGDLPPVLDLETSGGLGVRALQTWTSNFLTTVEDLTGRTPLIYCSPSFWRTYLGDSTAFTRYPLWIAHYTSAAAPSLPGGWTTWTFWQNTSSGRVNGISGNVDEDRFNGSLDDLKALAQVPPEVPAEPAPTEPADPPATEPVPTTTTLGSPAGPVSAGQSVTLAAVVLTGDGGAPVAAHTVALARRPVGSTSWERVATATTDADGHVSLVAVPEQSASYRARLLGDSSYLSSVSAPVDVAVMGAQPTRLTIGRTAARVRPGHQVTVYGHLTLADATGLAGERVVLLGRVLGTSTWRRVGAGTSVAPTGWWQVMARPRRPHAYKAVYRGSSAYAAARSSQVRVRIRR